MSSEKPNFTPDEELAAARVVIEAVRQTIPWAHEIKNSKAMGRIYNALYEYDMVVGTYV